MTAEARPVLNNPIPLYVVGLFSMGYVDFYIFLMPLYCLSLGMSAGEVGIIVGARSALAVFLSIHIGVLMDRFGTRRVTLFFVWTGICLAPVFPLLPWFWPLLLLQVVNGGALSFAWSGSQTLIAQLAEGDAGYIGRFSFFARIGTALAPTIAGVAWDLGGAWPAYLIGAAWGVVLTIALLRAPEAEIAPREMHPARPAAGFRLPDTLPRLSDYISCFALMAIPAVAATMAIMFLRTATSGVQFSLYIVYLNGIGLTGTAIGILFAAIEIASGFGSLFAGTSDALRRSAEDDAERHRLVDPLHLRDAIPGRHLCAAVPRPNGARLAAGRRAADDVFGAGQGGRALPPGFGRRAAADDEPPCGDHHPADHGSDRRLVGRDRELCRARRVSADRVRPHRPDHPPRGRNRRGRRGPRTHLRRAA